jgi:rhamnulokinase
LEELEELIESRIEVLQIVGGGANNSLLCQLTADVIGREVKAGPTESTALGNLVVQMISTGSLTDINEARDIIAESFEIKSFTPRQTAHLEEILIRWKELQLSKIQHQI